MASGGVPVTPASLSVASNPGSSHGGGYTLAMPSGKTFTFAGGSVTQCSYMLRAIAEQLGSETTHFQQQIAQAVWQAPLGAFLKKKSDEFKVDMCDLTPPV